VSILKGILSSSSLEATGLSNGVNSLNLPYIFSITPHLFFPEILTSLIFENGVYYNPHLMRTMASPIRTALEPFKGLKGSVFRGDIVAT
jgi:hypothetical protein